MASGMRTVTRWLAAALLALPALAAAHQSLPPGERPVRVAAGLFLVNLSGLADRSETFNADLYLSFRWQDARLAFAGTEPQRHVEDDAQTKLAEIWWPQLEFVNTAEPTITNRALTIFPDGRVQYVLGLTADFRADLDLRRFPFDRQRLPVRIESFTWTADDLVFVADEQRLGVSSEITFEGLQVLHVGAEIRRAEIVGWGETFSEFVGVIDVRRQAIFYLWTVFAPITLIFLISCTVFVVHVDNFQDRVAISLAALLACIATQFAMSFNLPQISYLTVIDRVFVVTYLCVAIGVLVSTLQAAFLRADRPRAARVDRWAGFGLPLLFLCLMAVCVWW